MSRDVDHLTDPAYDEGVEFEQGHREMKVNLTPDQKAFIRQAILAGRFRREEDAVEEALSLWEERERTRAEILAAVDKAEDSLARGEGRTITGKSMRELAESVKQRGRARLSRKLNPTSG